MNGAIWLLALSRSYTHLGFATAPYYPVYPDFYWQVCDPTIWERVKPVVFSVEQFEAINLSRAMGGCQVADVHCNDMCPKRFGRILKFRGIYFPALAADSKIEMTLFFKELRIVVSIVFNYFKRKTIHSWMISEIAAFFQLNTYNIFTFVEHNLQKMIGTMLYMFWEIKMKDKVTGAVATKKRWTQIFDSLFRPTPIDELCQAEMKQALNQLHDQSNFKHFEVLTRPIDIDS